MKTTLLSLFCILWLMTDVCAQTPRLEIHHIGAGDGDATLIIAIDSTTAYSPFTGAVKWDTCVVLMDGQRKGSTGKEVWRYVRDTIRANFPNRLTIDYMVVSHLHIDHYGGLINVLDSVYANKQTGWKIKSAVTRKMLLETTPPYPGNTTTVLDSCYSDINATNPDGTTLNSFFQKLERDSINQILVQPTENLFVIKSFINISMYCIVAGGVTIEPVSNILFSFLPYKTDAYGNKKYYNRNENDLSYGWFLTFQGFHYVSMGDLGGVNGGSYVDGETPVTDYLTGTFTNADYHLCSYKVSHHGSAESTIGTFVTRNNPTLVIVPACLRTYGSSTNPLPTQTAIQNLLANGTSTGINQTTKTAVQYTFIPYNAGTQSSYWEYQNLQYYNDVILKLVGGPGKGQNITFTLTQVPKNLNYSYGGAPAKSTVTFTCNKGHNW